jgi:hypothetical protein
MTLPNLGESIPNQGDAMKLAMLRGGSSAISQRYVGSPYLRRCGVPPMSMLLRSPSRYMSLPMAGDELETWTRQELEAMNARFVAQLEQAFELGLESRASAAGQIKLPVTAGAVQVTPLCPSVWAALLRSAAAGGIMVVARR